MKRPMKSLSDAAALSLFSGLQIHQYKSILVTSYHKVQSEKNVGNDEVRKEMHEYLEACAKDRKKKEKKMEKKMLKKMKKKEKKTGKKRYASGSSSSSSEEDEKPVSKKRKSLELGDEPQKKHSQSGSKEKKKPKEEGRKHKNELDEAVEKKDPDSEPAQPEITSVVKEVTPAAVSEVSQSSRCESIGSSTEKSGHETVQSVAPQFENMSTHQLFSTVLELELREKALQNMLARMKPAPTLNESAVNPESTHNETRPCKVVKLRRPKFDT